MKISFIIPVYNCKAYLPDCVDSIRAVGAEDYEILLIDDGSTDGSGAVCDELARRFPEIRVVHQHNAGASAARNRGISEAAGDLLVFVDSDDSIDSQALGRVLSDPRCWENDLTIFGMTFDYYHNGKCYRRDPMYFGFDGVMALGDWTEAFAELFLANSLSPIWNKVFRRDVIEQHGLLLDTSMFLYEDFEFVLRYMRFCNTIWNVPQAIYHYRQSEDEGNAGRRLKRIDSIPEFLGTIETALDALAVSETQRAKVLQLLHLTLANGKIAVSDVPGIRRICGEYRQWAENRCLPLEQDHLHRDLLAGDPWRLFLQKKKSRLRHWIAVRVKALLKRG